MGVLEPRYIAKCRNMDFGDLRKFVDTALSEVHEYSEKEVPRTKEDFTVLVNLLYEKIRAMNVPDLPPLPKKPATSTSQFAPSMELAEMYRERARRNELLAKAGRIKAKRDRKATIAEIKNENRAWSTLSQWLGSLEEQEKGLHERRERKRFEPYNQALAKRQKVLSKLSNEQLRLLKLAARRVEFVRRIEKRIENTHLSSEHVPMQRLPWRVLPPGENSVETVIHHYKRLQAHRPDAPYDLDRLEKILSLKPSGYYVGDGEFEKYIVLNFKHTPKALLECPLFGNAIYVIRSDWQKLSRLSKRELLAHSSRSAVKIVHRGKWFQRVKRELGVR